MNETVVALGGAGGLASMGVLLWQIVQWVRGKDTKRRQAEAARAVIDAEQAEASKPHVERALELGNFGEALSIQQGVINGMRQHAEWQDHELEARAKEIEELRKQLRERDEMVAELRAQLDDASKSLQKAWEIIRTLQPEPKRGKA